MMISMDDLAFVYLPKILLAIFCGSLIGLERELKEKPAGIKTYMLICTGATLFTMISIAFTDLFEHANEPSRVAAQIITGIGFIGAGTIMFSKGHVRGLTSAAAIWMSAAVGMTIGIGLYVFAVVVTLTIIMALIILGRLETKLGLKGKRQFNMALTLSTPEEAKKVRTLVNRSRGSCTISQLAREADATTMTITCSLTVKEMNNFQAAIQKLEGDISYKIE
ncbi:MAG: MgtC/SapB family protein [Thermoplasmata archaeon]|nr:MgtC/SapB family protein [Thermoplasmata archaeon]